MKFRIERNPYYYDDGFGIIRAQGWITIHCDGKQIASVDREEQIQEVIDRFQSEYQLPVEL